MKKTVSVILKIIATVLLISMLLFLVAYFADSDTYLRGRVRLSSFDNEQCKQFLLDQGVTAPEEFSNMDFRGLIADLEDDPDMAVILGWTALADFTEEIRAAVKSYYGFVTVPS